MRINRSLVPFLLLLSILFASCRQKDYSQAKSEFLLGTVCTVKLFDKADSKILTRVFDRVREIEGRMSVNIDTSEVSKINRNAGTAPVSVSPDTMEVIEKALRFSELSAGAFDITIGPLVKLWGIGTELARIPAPKEIEALLPLVDYRQVIIDKDKGTVYLKRQGMAVDLGAIAKGYAADEAARILKEEGIPRGIIDFGGNIYVLGSKEKNKPWRVGIQNPSKNRGEYLAIIAASDAALVSSGTYERFFIEDGKRYHHILDTKSGYPVQNGLSDVTIVAPSSTDADGLSTSVFTLGMEAGIDLIRTLSGVEGVFVTTDNRIEITPGLTDRLSVSDPAFSLTVSAP